MQDNIISLLDENGVESQFEVILTLEAENKEYAILMPVDDEEAEAIALKIITDAEGNEVLVTIDDEDEYEMVAEAYSTIFSDDELN